MKNAHLKAMGELHADIDELLGHGAGAAPGYRRLIQGLTPPKKMYEWVKVSSLRHHGFTSSVFNDRIDIVIIITFVIVIVIIIVIKIIIIHI